MLKNFILITFRSLIANIMFSAINILGLAIGLACVILIALFVQHESSYDKHWTNADRTYKVMRTFTPGNGSPDLHLATNAPQVGPLFRTDYPELEQVVRVMNPGQQMLTHPESNLPYYENGLVFTDAEVYKVFDIPLLQGDWESALTDPFQIVLSQTLAQKYFGDAVALGKTILFANQAPMRVSGVMTDLSENSHLLANAFISMSTVTSIFGENALQNWGSNNYHTYVVTPPNYNVTNFADDMPNFLTRHLGEDMPLFSYFNVIPLTDIHLHSQRDNELQANGNIIIVYTFSAIAVFILLIACLNFMNLSTARSSSRAREVGLRKTFGADRQQLVWQFLGESVVLTFFATLLAVLLVVLILPWFNNLVDLQLSLDYLNNPGVIALLAGLAIVVGFLAGLYPAFYMSAFPAARILKGEVTRGSGGASLRKFLVIVQFSISIGLVVAAGIALAQLRYAMNLDPGFTREQIVLYRGTNLEGLGSSYETMKQELLRHPEIVGVTAANLMPGDQNTNAEGIHYEGGPENFIGMAYLNVDFDFFETFDIDFISGRSFSRLRSTDLYQEPTEPNTVNTASFILNEIAARQLGYSPEDALNKWFEVGVSDDGGMAVRGPIIGVVDNINFSSIKEEVKPVFYRVMQNDNPESQFANFGQMAVRLSGRNLNDTLAFIEETWNQFLPMVPLRQSFLDQNIEALYRSEQRQGTLFTVFSVMAFVIAALGLFGLASYTTEQRTREIGVRKVLGSSVTAIVLLLTRDFTKLVLLANVIAWPVAWYFMNGWLQNFAYRTPMSIGIFLFAGLAAWLIASLTVGSLAALTANINPTRSLRHE